MTINKTSAIFVASILASTQMFAQAQSGASVATSSAIGGITAQQVVFATAAVAAVAAANSGSSGSAKLVLIENQLASTAAATATTASTQAATANTSISSAITSLLTAAGANPDRSITDKAATAQAAAIVAAAAQAAAAQAASDLDVASKVTVVGVVNGGRTICAASTTYTKAEVLALSLNAAQTAVASANATNYAIYLTTALRDQILAVNPTASVTAATALLTTAQTAAAAAQAAANTAISNYQATATAFGTTGTTITASTGTTGTTGTVGVTGTSGTTGTTGAN